MNFKNGLVISFGAHAVVILFMALKFIFFTPQIIDVSQAIRVDMVELPNKASENILPEKVQALLKSKPDVPTPPEPVSLPEPPAAPKTEEKKSEPLNNLAKSKLKQKNALNKLKKISAIEKIKQDLKKETKSTTPIKGRILSAGTKIVGLDKLQSDEYLSQLDAQIKSHWNLPQWMIGKPFKATVWVRLDTAGTVISKKILSSSGNPTYDEYCLAAVDKASPFPRVPDKFSEVYKTDGVSFAFPE